MRRKPVECCQPEDGIPATFGVVDDKIYGISDWFEQGVTANLCLAVPAGIAIDTWEAFLLYYHGRGFSTAGSRVQRSKSPLRFGHFWWLF
jgi:hypothetical protein